jgi:predicted DNA binding CopG/RHH family protein
MAEEEWVPYQTLLSAIIHKVANWKIEINVKC